MKIILEGCDGTGKTTLAKILADHYKLDIAHCSAEDPADYDFYYNCARKENIIWDRLLIGELIYPKIFNREPKLTYVEAIAISDKLKEMDVKIFVLTEDENIIRSRCEKRGNEDPRILNNISEINRKFLHYANSLNIPIINVSHMTMEEIFKVIDDYPNFPTTAKCDHCIYDCWERRLDCSKFIADL